MKSLFTIHTRWHYLLVLTPFVTDVIENGRLPHQPREFITEVILGLLIAAGVRYIRADNEKLRYVAETDALTGLYNRHRFSTDIKREMQLSQRVRAPLSLVYVDVDKFKSINDNYGHSQGDEVLKNVGQLLRHTARRELDYCYRLGGDEFGILLIGVTREQTEEMISHALNVEIKNYQYLQRYQVTLSCGVVQLGESENEASFLKRADAMMYWRKQKGRDGKNKASEQIHRALHNSINT